MRGACGTLLALCCLGAVGTLPAAGAGPPTGLTTVEWSGGLVFSWTVASSSTEKKGIPGNKAVTHLNWDAKAVLTAADLDNGTPVHWHYSRLEGSYTYDTTTGSNPIHCSSTLTEKAGYEGTNFDLANVTYMATTGEYLVTATAPFDTNALTTGLSQSDPCAAIAAGGVPQPGGSDPKGVALGKALSPTESVHAGGPYVFHYDASWQSPDQIATSSQVSSVLTVSAGLTGVAPPSATTTPSGTLSPLRDKAPLVEAALADLQPALEYAKVFCLPYAAGVGTFGAGVLLLGAPGTVGSVLTVAGSLTALASEPFCVAILTRLKNDYLIYRDPPDRAIFARAAPAAVPSARVGTCTRWRGADAAFCRKLDPALTHLVTDAERVASTSQALEATGSKLGSALASHQTTAIALQSKQALGLLAQVKSELGIEARAGTAVTQILGAAGLKMPLSSAQTGKAAAYVVGYLENHGVTAAEVRAHSGTALDAVPVDALAVLPHAAG